VSTHRRCLHIRLGGRILAGVDEASRCFTNSRMLSYFNALLASRMRRKNLEMFWTSASSRAVVALDMRASHPESTRN
jgi:hypothetical protein